MLDSFILVHTDISVLGIQSFLVDRKDTIEYSPAVNSIL